jgi:hypothetical protein
LVLLDLGEKTMVFNFSPGDSGLGKDQDTEGSRTKQAPLDKPQHSRVRPVLRMVRRWESKGWTLNTY